MIAETEASFQATVVQLAELHGWRTFHVYDSRRSNPGFPDLVLVRDGRLIFAELKTEKGKVSPAQTEWLAALEQVAAQAERPGWGGEPRIPIEVHVWRPRDWPQIESTLSRRRNP